MERQWGLVSYAHPLQDIQNVDGSAWWSHNLTNPDVSPRAPGSLGPQHRRRNWWVFSLSLCSPVCAEGGTVSSYRVCSMRETLSEHCSQQPRKWMGWLGRRGGFFLRGGGFFATHLQSAARGLSFVGLGQNTALMCLNCLYNVTLFPLILACSSAIIGLIGPLLIVSAYALFY